MRPVDSEELSLYLSLHLGRVACVNCTHHTIRIMIKPLFKKLKNNTYDANEDNLPSFKLLRQGKLYMR